ncbi:SDR family oxidoreductase [Streptomyces olivaceus]|uniref:SDR family oxidoreductase n=1 Tax=Streptomyces olivaceus TaxID=47716 RepID=UPI0033A47B9A
MPAPAALIAGGTSGIGRATAELLHSRGHRVMVTGSGGHAGAELPGDIVIVRAGARSLALELAPGRIRVNAVSPGLTDTPAHGKLGVSREMIESWGADVPLGRAGAAADVAEAVAFLASDAAGYITGENLAVSGGLGVHARP